MKLHLKRSEGTRGFLKKTTDYIIDVRIELSADEQATAKKTGINDYVFFEHSYRGVDFAPKLSWLTGAKGWQFKFEDFVESNEAEQKIKELCAGVAETLREAMGDTEKEEVIEF